MTLNPDSKIRRKLKNIFKSVDLLQTFGAKNSYGSCAKHGQYGILNILLIQYCHIFRVIVAFVNYVVSL